jgi:hypothetical protein
MVPRRVERAWHAVPGVLSETSNRAGCARGWQASPAFAASQRRSRRLNGNSRNRASPFARRRTCAPPRSCADHRALWNARGVRTTRGSSPSSFSRSLSLSCIKQPSSVYCTWFRKNRTLYEQLPASRRKTRSGIYAIADKTEPPFWRGGWGGVETRQELHTVLCSRAGILAICRRGRIKHQ